MQVNSVHKKHLLSVMPQCLFSGEAVQKGESSQK